MISRDLKRNLRHWKFKLRRKLFRGTILPTVESHHCVGQQIMNQTPAAIGKIGSTELLGLKNLSLYKKNESHLQSKQGQRAIYKLYKNSGVFPQDKSTYLDFCNTYTESLSKMSHLAPWFPKGEPRIIKHYAQQAVMISDNPLFLLPLSPDNKDHWTHNLQGKTILTVHPFTQTITDQFPRRSKIWPGDAPFLPECTLKTLKIPLYDAIVPSPYSNWFEGLSEMKAQMSAIDFDVALIGAGAWSLPLAVHAKELGKIGIHLGGATQLLFGIKGKRWDSKGDPYFYNDSWVRPSSDETPETADIVEGGCYW